MKLNDEQTKISFDVYNSFIDSAYKILNEDNPDIDFLEVNNIQLMLLLHVLS